MMTLDEKTLLLQQQPNLIVLFKYSTFNKVASTITQTNKVYYKPSYKRFFYQKFYDHKFVSSSFVGEVELKEVVSHWDEESEEKHEDIIKTDTWFKDVGDNGVCVNKIFWQNKKVELFIGGEYYVFKHTSSKMNEENNTLTLIMELENSEERIMANDKEYSEHFYALHQEVNKHNDQVKEEVELAYFKKKEEEELKLRKELQKQYESFSIFKKFFGGEKLKK